MAKVLLKKKVNGRLRFFGEQNVKVRLENGWELVEEEKKTNKKKSK